MRFGFGFAFGGVFAQGGALGVDADPVVALPLEDVGEDAAFFELAVGAFVVEGVGAVGYSYVAHDADGNDALIGGGGFVFAIDEAGDLLIAGGDVAGGGDVYEER